MILKVGGGMNNLQHLKKKLTAIFLILFLALPFFNELYADSPTFNDTQHINLPAGPPTLVRAEEETINPNVPDDFFPDSSSSHPQWNHNAMHIGEAWADGYTGLGIKIAILDTGFYHRHPDISMAGGYSVFSDDAWSNDHSGHGTHIAGIIGAKRGTAYQGIAPDAEIFGIKIYHSSNVDEDGGISTDVSSVIKGFRKAIDIDADIILISSGLDYHDEGLYEIIQEAHSKNIMVIAASGNGKTSVNYPARYKEVIAVTAVDEYLNPALDIIYGQENDFCAPGVSIGGLSIPDSAYSYPYIFMSGSSQAAPHAAGLAAILMQKYNKRGDDIRKIMERQALDIGESGFFGHGLLHYATGPEHAEEPSDSNIEDNTSDAEISTTPPDEDELRVNKPIVSREADQEEDNELLEYHKTEAILVNGNGTLRDDILSLIDTGGVLGIDLGNIESILLTDHEIAEIRQRNITLILSKDHVTWTIPPGNFISGEALVRFYAGTPVGVQNEAEAGPSPYTISIYQGESHREFYPSWMKVTFDFSHVDSDILSNLEGFFWNMSESKWELADAEKSNDSDIYTITTRNTTALGFFNPQLMEKEKIIEEEDPTIMEQVSGFFSSLTGKFVIGIGMFALMLFGIKFLFEKK